MIEVGFTIQTLREVKRIVKPDHKWEVQEGTGSVSFIAQITPVGFGILVLRAQSIDCSAQSGKADNYARHAEKKPDAQQY